MPWVRFTGRFDFKPKASVTIAYSPGLTKLVTRDCAKAAVAAGAAIVIARPTPMLAERTKETDLDQIQYQRP